MWLLHKQCHSEIGIGKVYGENSDHIVCSKLSCPCWITYIYMFGIFRLIFYMYKISTEGYIMIFVVLLFCYVNIIFNVIQVKVFGSLVKGLRTALSLLLLLQKEQPLISSLTKVFKLPILTGSNGLDQFLAQFEAAVDSDFPNYQVFFLTWHLNLGLFGLIRVIV